MVNEVGELISIRRPFFDPHKFSNQLDLLAAFQVARPKERYTTAELLCFVCCFFIWLALSATGLYMAYLGLGVFMTLTKTCPTPALPTVSSYLASRRFQHMALDVVWRDSSLSALGLGMTITSLWWQGEVCCLSGALFTRALARLTLGTWCLSHAQRLHGPVGQALCLVACFYI